MQFTPFYPESFCDKNLAIRIVFVFFLTLTLFQMYFNVSSLEPTCGTRVQCPIKNHKENKGLHIMKFIQKVILRKTMRTTINFYLVNLSAADLLSTLWCPLHRCFFLTVSVNCLRHFQGKVL